MPPDLTTPDTCPTCGDRKSHDSYAFFALGAVVRVFECGSTASNMHGGPFSTVLGCPRASDVIAQLRAENARLRRELDAIAELAEEALGEWLAVSPLYVPERLAALHSIYHRAAAPTADPGAAETVTVGAVLGSGSAVNGSGTSYP